MKKNEYFSHFHIYSISSSPLSWLLRMIPLPRYSQMTSNLSRLYFNLDMKLSTSVTAASNCCFLSSRRWLSNEHFTQSFGYLSLLLIVFLCTRSDSSRYRSARTGSEVMAVWESSHMLRTSWPRIPSPVSSVSCTQHGCQLPSSVSPSPTYSRCLSMSCLPLSVLIYIYKYILPYWWSRSWLIWNWRSYSDSGCSVWGEERVIGCWRCTREFIRFYLRTYSQPLKSTSMLGSLLSLYYKLNTID
jgi:hypothetical protein